MSIALTIFYPYIAMSVLDGVHIMSTIAHYDVNGVLCNIIQANSFILAKLNNM